MQLPALLNGLTREGPCRLEVDSPWTDKPIVSLRISDSLPLVDVETVVKPEDFNHAASKEGIDMMTVRGAVTSSGVMRPATWAHLSNEVEKRVGRNLLSGERPTRIMFDTVALNRRYFTLTHRLLLEKERGASHAGWGVGYVVTEGVMRELTAYKRKYTAKDLQSLSCNVHCDWFDMKGVTNQLMAKDRQFRIGEVEAKKLSTTGRTVRLRSKQGDDSIIEAVGYFERMNPVDILALSEDGDFVSKCRLHGMSAIRLDLPPLSKNTLHCDWQCASDLLYLLAVLMASVRVRTDRGPEAVLCGVWAGKKEENWNDEEISVSSGDMRLTKWLHDFRNIAY